MLLTGGAGAAGGRPEPRRLAFFGGKGGVGKTTLATAYATLLAAGGQRTLLVSTDPAHSTGDLLGVGLGNAPTAVADRLDAVEVDAEADATAYVERIKADARDALSREVLATVDRHLELARHSPGTLESALFDRFVDLIGRCPDPYARIVFDTAPTGHTLRLLALPALLTGWVEGLVRRREQVAGMDRMLRNLAGSPEPAGDDPIVARLRERRERFRVARQRLLDDAAFHLVLVPERLPIEETDRAARTLADHDVTVATLLVNRVLPPDVDGAFLRERAAQEAEYLAEVQRRFAGRRIVRVRQAPRDVTGPDQLGPIADQLAAAEL